MVIGDEKYVSTATYRRSGEQVATATWITPLPDGRVGFWTSSQSGKAKRLRNDARVTLQPSDSRGRVKADTPPVSGRAELVSSGPDFDAVHAQIRAKYGVMVGVSRLLNTIGHLGKKAPYADLVVVVTADSQSSAP